jgi:Tfp pilus assembly protein PilN
MRAVNLLPSDSQRGGGPGGLSLGHLGPVHVVLGVLVILLAYVTLYVLTGNTISQRKSQLAALHLQVSQEQAQITRLTSFTQFEKLAQQRADTVRQIAASRFDWHGALSDLSKVMPANASLESLTATVAPGASVSGAGGSAGGASSVRPDVNAPAFELKGCTATQDDVARLISRLRLINGVQRVTLEDSSKSTGEGGTTGTSSTSSSTGAGAPQGGCAGNGPTFDMVVFFQPLPGAPASSGSSSAAGAPVTTPGGATAAATSGSQQASSPGTAAAK